MAGVARPQADGHISSRVSAAQSSREGRRVERPAESHGRARLAVAQEVEVLKICHGNSSWPGYRTVLGISGPFCQICHSPARHIPHDAVYAGVRILLGDAGDAAPRGLGASLRWLRLAAMGL